MDDYLTMIKNPKRKPSTSPAPGPSTQSRTSAPFPNQSNPPSTTPPYINNLDRLKSTDSRPFPTNIRDPQGAPSPRPALYEPSYEPFRADPSPRTNRFSAPISSIGERPSIPTASLFGEVQPKPQNALGAYKSPYVDQDSNMRDKSPRGLFGSDMGGHSGQGQVRRPAELGTPATLLNNNGLFGETSYKGSSTQDSTGVFKRKSSNSQQSVPMKLSNGSRNSQDVSPKFEKKDRVDREKKKSKKKKMEISIIVLGVLLVLLVVVAAVVMLVPKQEAVFCDSEGGKDPTPGCVACPEHGICRKGKLSCESGYKKYKNDCVLDYELIAKYGQYRKYINDRLAFFKGEKLCNPVVRDFLTLTQIKNELRAGYPRDPELSELNYHFDDRWHSYFNVEEGLERVQTDDQIIYRTIDEPSPSLSCKIKLLWRNGKLAGIWFTLLVATIALTARVVRTYWIYSKLGKEMYEDVRYYLTQFKNVSVIILKKEFEHKYPGKNFEKIWSYVESYRKQDARIYQYFDLHDGVNTEFWLRVR